MMILPFSAAVVFLFCSLIKKTQNTRYLFVYQNNNMYICVNEKAMATIKPPMAKKKNKMREQHTEIQ
jgi:hypothetical protein